MGSPLVAAGAFFLATFIAGYACGFLHGTSWLDDVEPASQPDERMAPVVAIDSFGEPDGAA